jgi:hypothetical protein
MDDLNDKHIAVLRKAASAVKDRGHEGDARLADSVLGIVASLTARRAPAAAPIVQPVGDAPAFTEEMALQASHIRNDIEFQDLAAMWESMWRAAAPVVQAEPVHVLDAAMSLLRVARKLDVNRITPARLRQQVIESAGIAEGAEGEGEEYIFADVYGHLVEMIGPYVPANEREEGHPFTASVTDTMAQLIEYWKRTSAAPTTAAADAKDVASASGWQPITKPGQVRVGDKLRFTIGDDRYSETAKELLHAGTEQEEIIYNKRRNYYLITSMAIANRGSQKNVEFLAAIATSADEVKS